MLKFLKDQIIDFKVWLIKREYKRHIHDFIDSLEAQGYALTHGTVTVRYSSRWININKLAELNEEHKRIQREYNQKLIALGREE